MSKVPKVEVRLRRDSLHLLYKSLALAVWKTRNQNNEMTT
jgi:hypothetical protein